MSIIINLIYYKKRETPFSKTKYDSISDSVQVPWGKGEKDTIYGVKRNETENRYSS